MTTIIKATTVKAEMPKQRLWIDLTESEKKDRDFLRYISEKTTRCTEPS